jgi:hypothetical protein
MDKIKEEMKRELKTALYELDILQEEYNNLYFIFNELCEHLRQNNLEKVEEFLERGKKSNGEDK